MLSVTSIAEVNVVLKPSSTGVNTETDDSERVGSTLKLNEVAVLCLDFALFLYEPRNLCPKGLGNYDGVVVRLRNLSHLTILD